MTQDFIRLAQALAGSGIKRRRRGLAPDLFRTEDLAAGGLPPRLERNLRRLAFHLYESDDDPDAGSDAVERPAPAAKTTKAKKPPRFPLDLIYGENNRPLTARQAYRRHIAGWNRDGTPEFSTRLSWDDREKAQDNFYRYRENYWNRFGRTYTLRLLGDIEFATDISEISLRQRALTNSRLTAALKEDDAHADTYSAALMRAIGSNPDKLNLLDETLQSRGYYQRWMQAIQTANEAEGRPLPVPPALVPAVMRRQLPKNLRKHAAHYLHYHDSTLTAWVMACCQPERPVPVRAEGIRLLAHLTRLHKPMARYLRTDALVLIVAAAPEGSARSAARLRDIYLGKEESDLRYYEQAVDEGEQAILEAQRKLMQARDNLSRQQQKLTRLQNN